MDKRLKDKYWRITHLYKIVDKNGKLITFKPNEVQAKLHREAHQRNIILKARQRGITTYECIDGLDDALFNRNFNFTLIADKQENAKKFFKKIKLAWKHFSLKHLYEITKETQEDLEFAHGSSITITTSARSTTVNRLHISEFGKICAKFPEKAREIITGSIPAVSPTGRIDIESTAEGETGYYYEMCQEALNRGEPTNRLEFKFHFFSWLDALEYRLKGKFDLPRELKEYQARYKLTDEQINWYYFERKTQKDKMKQEFPTTPEEAFESSGQKMFPIEIIKWKLENEIREGETMGDWITYKPYRPGHQYGLGADVSEGIGRDSSTIVIIDYTAGEIVARYKSENISPDLFAYEIKNGAERYGNCIVAPERNNHGHATLAILKTIYSVDRIYKEHKVDTVFDTEGVKLGWQTNLATKPRILNELKTTVEENLLIVPDRALLVEMKVYDREELNKLKADTEASNHFDILTACAIAWEMRKHAISPISLDKQSKLIYKNERNYIEDPYS